MIWGIPYLLIKLAIVDLSPLVVAWVRVTLAACVLLPIAWRRGGLKALGAHRGALLIFSLVEFTLPFTAIALGERWVSSSVAGILIATVPMSVALLARGFGLHEPMSNRRIAGLVLGFLGVVCLLGLGTISGTRGWLGVGCLLVSAFGYSLGPLIIQRHLRGLDASGSLAVSLGISSVLLALPAWMARPLHAPTPEALVAVALLGLLCTAIAMLLLFYLVAKAGAARASLITYVNPAVATVLGTVLLHERLGWGGLVGFLLILCGSWFASRRTDAG